ncbi:hypothetical protein D3C76_673240 [compost metagenome]
MLPLHEHEIGEVIEALRARGDPRITLGDMRHVVESRQATGLADGETRARQRRVGTRQPHHDIGADGLQGQFAVEADDVQASTGIASQQRHQIATEDVVQDGLGDRKSHPWLLDHRQLPFMGQRCQLPVQLQAVTTEHQTVLRRAKQRTLQLLFKLSQVLAQQGCLDIEAPGGLHEAAATGSNAEAPCLLRIDLRRTVAPGRGFIERGGILR